MRKVYFDTRFGPIIRLYLSRGCFGLPGLSLLVETWRIDAVFHAPYLDFRDLWVGIFHRRVINCSGGPKRRDRDFFLCPLPAVVFKVSIGYTSRPMVRA